ncbi:MAG: LacI family DNA-binding transcriptional regulator, partial [Caulobacterales bacterium]|nr:LacI family DNA-binding transcriptional regulator [Caulobacterales bacterium]
VLQSIRELNYAPNISARRLAGGRSARICLLYGNPSSAYLGELLVGALEVASELGHHLIVERVNEAVSPAAFYKGLDQMWDGLIVPPPISDVASFRRLVGKESFPTVFLSSSAKRARPNEICIDDYHAARDMTGFLIEKGHRRLGFVKGHPNQAVSDRRYRGFVDAAEAAGLAVGELRVAQGYFTYRSGLAAGDELLGDAPAPTAIFAANDDMAAGVLAAAARRGLHVPAELSVCGFDDSPIASTVWPNLTTVRQPVAEMAGSAVRLIDRLIAADGEGASARGAARYAPYSISVRDSVGAPPGA